MTMGQNKEKGLWISEEILNLDITLSEKLILAHIRNLYRAKQEPVFCYSKYIADFLRISEVAVRRAIGTLEEKGLIEITKEKYKDGVRNLYTVIEERIAEPIKKEPKRETSTTTPEAVKKEIDRLIMPAVSYNYHQLGDTNFDAVTTFLTPMKNDGYFRNRCKEIRETPVLPTPLWAGYARNFIDRYPKHFATPFLEYTLEQSDDRIKAAAIR